MTSLREVFVTAHDSSDRPGVAPWSLPDLRVVPRDDAGEVGAVRTGPTPEEEAYERGCEDGARHERAAMEDRLTRACQAIDQVLAELTQRLAGVDEAVAQTAFALALAVTEQLVGREVVCDRRIVRDLVRRALEAAPADEPIEVRLHPDDLRLLSARAEFSKAEGSMRDIRWVADQSVGRGGCFVETPSRIVDGRIDATLRRFAEGFQDG